MIVICEECGRKYRIDPSKIKGKAASFKCRSCTHVIVVSKPEPPQRDSRPTLESITSTVDIGPTTAAADAGQRPARTGRRTKGVGLRTKMLLLFMLVPLILMAGASLLYLWQLETMSNLLTRDSAKFVNQLAEEKIADISTSVAIQSKRMQARAKVLTDRARLITLGVLGLTLLLVGLIVSIYGHRLTGKIKSLTDVADRISVGELGMEIKTTSKDEIGELAEAIARMQDSIRLSIERLRRRR